MTMRTETYQDILGGICAAIILIASSGCGSDEEIAWARYDAQEPPIPACRVCYPEEGPWDGHPICDPVTGVLADIVCPTELPVPAMCTGVPTYYGHPDILVIDEWQEEPYVGLPRLCTQAWGTYVPPPPMP